MCIFPIVAGSTGKREVPDLVTEMRKRRLVDKMFKVSRVVVVQLTSAKAATSHLRLPKRGFKPAAERICDICLGPPCQAGQSSGCGPDRIAGGWNNFLESDVHR